MKILAYTRPTDKASCFKNIIQAIHEYELEYLNTDIGEAEYDESRDDRIVDACVELENAISSAYGSLD